MDRASELDPAIIECVEAFLRRYERGNGKGGYPTANERYCIGKVLERARASS